MSCSTGSMFVGGEGVSHEGLVIAAVGDSSRRRGVVGAMSCFPELLAAYVRLSERYPGREVFSGEELFKEAGIELSRVGGEANEDGAVDPSGSRGGEGDVLGCGEAGGVEFECVGTDGVKEGGRG